MEVCDKYLHEYMKINPTLNDFFLKKEYLSKRHIQPNIYTEEYYDKLNKLDNKYLDILAKNDNLSIYDKLLQEDIKYNIHMEEEYEIYDYMPIDIMDNILISYVTESSGEGSYQFTKKKDYDDFINRLKSLNEITEEIISKMKDGIKAKITLYFKTVDQMIESIQEIIKKDLYLNQTKSIHQKRLNKSIEIYLAKNLTKLLHFLMNEYYPHCSKTFGLMSYKGGKKKYENIVRYNTLRDLTPQKIHDFGKKELKKLIKLKDDLGKHLNIENIDDFVKTKKSFYYTNEKDILNDLRKIRTNLQTDIYEKNFHGKILKKDLYDIKPVPIESKHMTAYYVSPDMNKNNTKKGTFYINTLNPQEVNRHELYVLSLHEGIPGHHYEMTTHQKENLPDYLKISGYSSYSEGWGLYSESLGEYKKDIKYYYKLQYDIHRTIRLIIDTAIHYFGWEYDKCFNFMKKHLSFPDNYLHKELIRYINIPGQALTYKIGEKTIFFLRNKSLKEGMSIKDFHQKIMDKGPCNLDILLDQFNTC
jgi:uncharacterized protein (DUF885 family)